MSRKLRTRSRVTWPASIFPARPSAMRSSRGSPITQADAEWANCVERPHRALRHQLCADDSWPARRWQILRALRQTQETWVRSNLRLGRTDLLDDCSLIRGITLNIIFIYI